jgi:NitT/TauT family transport system permease protein
VTGAWLRLLTRAREKSLRAQGASILDSKAGKTGFFVLLILLWQGLFMLGLWPAYVFPSPLQVVGSLARDLSNGTLIVGIATSMRRVAIGYGFSLVAGTLLGLLLGRVRYLDQTLGSLVLGLQTLPSICWLPLALLWFGLDESAIVFVVIMGALLSITVATEDGVKNTPPAYLQAARNLGSAGWKLYAFVILPAALPSYVTGMKLGWSFAWRSLMAGELLYVTLGLGQLLMMGRDLNDMSQVIAVMLVIIALGLAIDRLGFAPLERRVRQRWGLRAE